MRLTGSQRRSSTVDPVDASTLTAAIIDSAGTEPRVGSIDMPRRRPGTTVLSVFAAALNPLDLAIASGSFHSVRHEAPYVPGSECVGIVIDSDRYDIGTWMYAETHASPSVPGSFATHVMVPDNSLLPLPDGLDPILAAAVGNSGTAAYMPLVQQAQLRAGDTVLILGATGAVGQLAVQIAREQGAGKIVAVARNRVALERSKMLGAHAVVALQDNESSEALTGRLSETAGQPVDVVLDGLYGIPLEAALHVCAPRAKVVNIGNSAGAVARVPAGLLRGKQITLSGFAGLHTPLQEKAEALTWLWDALLRKAIEFDVRTYPLTEIRTAWHAQANSPHGKCVILPTDGILS
ncbi:zinc-binding alcohol dehydrogenase family protein [Rhodococcus sp. PAMC28707]|uniref:quinone oxidoreductase family protein n=1 Tax=unclassified Rhodococcus (in: high G+C Gram-positive bacteria) TaxID=192944 RepID=UPI00109D82B1|nr:MULTISPECIES: zinc-binding alcohol dehydrogenase family protein [unclassified Rhodococcus (in: high G+C Gram-positive bacteria)]QCB51772.1 zinc-binding alcohol dehydrogenase family protein [Rhodococcus sp. PAMC28705]QCB60060.1 zinc-binding alcohol dehydrogenase family protein [Rhodococcus sp. PAMC28707]